MEATYFWNITKGVGIMVRLNTDCEECGGLGYVHESSRWSSDGVREVPCICVDVEPDYEDYRWSDFD